MKEQDRRNAFIYALLMTARNILNHARGVSANIHKPELITGDPEIERVHDEVDKIMRKYWERTEAVDE